MKKKLKKMKRKMVYYMELFVIWCFLKINSVVNAVSLYIPKQGNAVDYDTRGKVQLDWNYSILDIIKFVNDYLWFAIWFVCFLFVVVNGIKLIISRWDEQETKKAMHVLVWCVIWILVCLWAYIIVNLAIRLFA